LDLAVGFSLLGGAAVRVFCEFERRPPNRALIGGAHPLVLEVVTDKSDDWDEVLSFNLRVRPEDVETMTNRFIALRMA
jgi:hypothetical protein